MTETAAVAVVGCGVTGRRLARRLAAEATPLVLHDLDRAAARVLAGQLSGTAVDDLVDLVGAAVVICCQPGPHAPLAERLLSVGTPVISLADALDDVRDLLAMQRVATASGSWMVVGAGMAPGLSGLLAAQLARQLALADEVHIGVHGTGGPACATQHHRSLGDTAVGWHDGEWIERPGGSGRELCWFPEPIGPRDCYRAALADPVLLHEAMPHLQRISARTSATRRDRMTARLPMLVPPHADGDRGALRVEVRGADRHGAREALVIGASGDVADVAAAVAAATVRQCLGDPPAAGVHVLGAGTLPDQRIVADACRFGVRLQEFTGAPQG